MSEDYPNLADPTEFPPIEKSTGELPNPFDMTCRSCGGTLERSSVPIRTRQRPFAVLQCNECSEFLYLFGDVKDPLVVSGNKLRGSTTFSQDIDRMFAERQLDRERKQTRAEGVLVPPLEVHDEKEPPLPHR